MVDWEGTCLQNSKKSGFDSHPSVQLKDTYMNKIQCHGEIAVPDELVSNADTIKFQHYKVNTPSRFQKRSDIDTEFKKRLAAKIGLDFETLDFVYFSVCKGAEPHVDQLDPAIFTSRTFVIPVILPRGNSIITAEDQREIVKLNHVYEFNHERVHSMEVEDTESGCVVIMVAEKK